MTSILAREELDKLEGLAKEATSGPWFLHDFSHPTLVDKPTAYDVTVSCDHPATITLASMGGGLFGSEGVQQARKDAAFIAAANPQAILSIAEYVRTLSSEIEQLKAERDRAWNAGRDAGAEYLFGIAKIMRNPNDEDYDDTSEREAGHIDYLGQGIRALTPKQEE